uniref:Retrotransposon protein n=2 Tax=Oryza sativa subsp. japonica TaxID=39947 RepID=A0A5S6R9P4_ORYSJ|nr:putative retrotransposon protein [Oryza sativa Japonica Group]AAR96230.1 putative gypsy-type retrotransposon protein [Oryza sativa Japonica Group]ABF96265.1 retrotransposon protein, putative, Ty3-gypsy subclass [Oryza sativa Japonica Group]
MAEEKESFEGQWAPSDVTEENLKEMVAHGVLPAKEIIGWRPACGEAFPTPDTHEAVVFSHFFYGGFALPTSKFFRGILSFYGISLHHLNPNSIVHIANFVHPQPNKSKPCVVGGAGFQLRGTLSQKYFSMPFKTSNKGWHANWFYIQNPEPALPEYSCLPPVYQDTWNSLPIGDEAAQALELMDRMLKLKEQGLQGEQITRHFIKCRLAPIKERSRTAFEFDGKHDPNREEPDSLDFKIMKERMCKIFSNAIVVSYSHQLPVVPYNAFNPPPQEYVLMKSDPPITQRRSPRQHTVQGGGGPTIRSDPQPQTSNPTGQTGSRKRKLVLNDNEGDDGNKSGDEGSPNKLPKHTTPRKKLASRPRPKIRTSSRYKPLGTISLRHASLMEIILNIERTLCRKPSDIDPTGKDPDPTVTEPSSSKDSEPTAESQPTGAHTSGDKANPSDQPPTGNQSAATETTTTQEPPTGNQSDVGPDQETPEVEAQTTTSQGPEAGNDSIIGSPDKEQGSPHAQLGTSSRPPGDDEEEIPRIKAADDSRPPILLKWWDENSQAAGIVINRQKEDEEVCQLKKALGEATRIVNRIHLRNEAKTATLEKLVPHLGTLEVVRDQLHEAKELAKKTEKELRDRIAQLQDSNFELSGSSKAQAARMAQMEKQIEALERDKVELAAQRDSALKEVEDRKIKSQAQFDVLVGKIKRLEEARDEVANVATPLVQAMFLNNSGPSALDATEIFDKLRVAPDVYFKNIKKAGSMGASTALAMTKSLYPRIEIDAIDGFADGTSVEAALDLISNAQNAANKIASDVVDQFRNTDLQPSSNNSDDERTDSD